MSDPSRSAPTRGAATGTDAPPVLVLDTICGGACGPQRAPGVPVLAVYGDGTLFSTAFEPSDGHLVVRTGKATPAQMDELDSQLAAVSHDDFANAMSGSESLDYVIARLADGKIRVEQVFEMLAQTDSLGPLAVTLSALRSAATAPWSQRWAMLALPGDATAPSRPGSAMTGWNGPDPATLPATGPYGMRCLVLETGDALRLRTTLEARTFNRDHAVGASLWTIYGRPLLPHERTCEDLGRTSAEVPVPADIALRN